MFEQSKVSQAVALAIASGAIGVSGTAVAQQAQERRVIEEIVVTATKRVESMQDIPVTVQALGEDELESLDINSFADYVQQLPNVTFAGRGPGQNDVYIRGITTGRGSLFQSGGIGAGPTVAFYVDEAPLTSSGRNVDVYVTDIARIEVLPGPQGTLYGASSQAGTVRLITNKPDPIGFSSGFDVSASATEEGEESWGAEGYLNIPIVEDRFAIRIAAYNIESGGYIDNVPGTLSYNFNPAIADGSLPLAPGAEIRVANNDSFVEDDFNDSTYTGARVSGTFFVNDDWDVNVGVMTQELEADGVFDYSPGVGDLQVQRFNDDFLDDDFTQFNWTVNGRVRELEIVYAGSFLNREIEQRMDYVGGTRLSFFPFYNCVYNALGEITLCAAPDARFHGIQDSDDTQHEFRISTDPARAWHFIGGVYYDKSEGGVSQEWEYHSPQIQPPGLEWAPNAPHSQATHFNPNVRDPEVAFFNDLSNEAEQIAFFGELTYRFNDSWSATLGLRNYDIDIVPRGSFNFATRGPVDGDGGGSLDSFTPANDSDTIGKFTVNFTPNDDLTLYATLSEGFRRGGFNRGGDVLDMSGTVLFPAFYKSDTIDNYELGWKTTLADGTLRFNGAAYFIDWSDIQIDIFDPAISFLLFTANVGEAEVKGIEGDFTWYPTDQFTLTGAFSFNDTELTSRPSGADNLLPAGSDLPLSPSFQGNLTGRYDFQIGDWESFAQLSVRHSGDSFTTLVVANAENLDSYTIVDASFGVDFEGWRVSLFLSNLTDERSELFKTIQDEIRRTVTSRPRTLSLRLSRDF
ncbi:MAG: TonB-dependent receptor [Woeseia sp.]